MTANVLSSKGEPAVVTALAGGATITAAAQAGGVSERTVRRRLDEPEYADAVRDARTAMFERALGTLARATTDAAGALIRLLDADAEHVRLGAARTVIDQAARLHDHVELSARLAAMEGAIEELRAERDERARQEAAGLRAVPAVTARARP